MTKLEIESSQMQVMNKLLKVEWMSNQTLALFKSHLISLTILYSNLSGGFLDITSTHSSIVFSQTLEMYAFYSLCTIERVVHCSFNFIIIFHHIL